MLRITHRYAHALMDFAHEYGFEEIYQQALELVADDDMAGKKEINGELGRFMSVVRVGPEEVNAVLNRFVELAREHMNTLEAEIISAVPLTGQQLARVEERLIRTFKKKLDIKTTVDPSLIGGLRVIVDNVVLDESIKRMLSDMKAAIYEGVYTVQ